MAALLAASCGGSGGQSADSGPSPIDAAPPADSLLPTDGATSAMVTVDYLQPNHGPFSGGTKIVLRGRGFTSSMTVLIGGRMVDPTDLTVVDDRRAVIVSPAGNPGPADVEVDSMGLSGVKPNGYSYDQIFVDPPEGAVPGGTFVTINGLGTHFSPTSTVMIGGAPLENTIVLNVEAISGFTPPGIAGTTDVSVDDGAGTVIDAQDAYTYVATVDPFSGGFGGGPITGSLNVTVMDTYTSNGVPNCFVTLGDPTSTMFSGYTDAFGGITFSAPMMTGPVTLTAGRPGYERGSMFVFDAANATIFLTPTPPPAPPPGGFPPGKENGTVDGAILFGGPTGLGVPTWDLVPEPRTPTEHKRAYVFTSLRDPFTQNPTPGPMGVVDYTNDGRTSWDFEITARPAALAVWAVAGLYDSAIDPDGPGPLPAGVFEGFAMGAARGIFVGPGEVVKNVDVVIDVPLDTSLPITLVSPPPLGTAGWPGPDHYQAQAFIDLGGEGVINLPGTKVTFTPGSLSTLVTHLAPIESSISDSSYTIFAGAFSQGGGAPYSVRVMRGVNDLDVPVVVDDFLGVPRTVDPMAVEPPGSGMPVPATAMHLDWMPEGPTNGVATFTQHRLQLQVDGTPEWRILTAGAMTDVPLYDLVTTGGVPPMPSPDPLQWTIYEVTVPGLTFDHFTYRDLNANYWSAYAVDSFSVALPANP
jgi:hypothetical protein